MTEVTAMALWNGPKNGICREETANSDIMAAAEDGDALTYVVLFFRITCALQWRRNRFGAVAVGRRRRRCFVANKDAALMRQSSHPFAGRYGYRLSVDNGIIAIS